MPFHVREKVEEKLWVSLTVVVPKPHGAVNQTILCERHVIPSVDDFVADGCSVYRRIDYHQILLHPESRHHKSCSTESSRKSSMMSSVISP